MNSPDYSVSFPGLGIQNLEIAREAFSIGPITVYWYGLLIAFAVLLAMFLALRHCRRFGISQDDVLDMYLVAILTGLVGARVYYVIFEWPRFADDWRRIFSMREGGLAFYGGVIGGILAVWVLGRIKKLPFHQLADFFIPYVAIGQAIGRWGNFFNQEAFGTNTSLPWGMYSNGTRDYLSQLSMPGIDPNAPVHPTFLYESLANLVIFFFLLRIRRQSRARYEVFAWYILLYGGVRFFTEALRTDSLYIGGTGLRASQILSAVMVVAGLAWLIRIWILDRSRSRREEMAVLLGRTADGAELDESVPEVDAEEAELFELHVAAREGTDRPNADTKVHDFSESEAFARAAEEAQAVEDAEVEAEARAAAARIEPSVEPAADEEIMELEALREAARQAAERALQASSDTDGTPSDPVNGDDADSSRG